MADRPSSDEQLTAAEAIQQIPAVIQVQQPSAVTDARDKLLAAICAEPQLVVEKSAGQAAALGELARVYALASGFHEAGCPAA